MTCQQAVDALTGRIECLAGSQLPDALERHLGQCPDCAGRLERTATIRQLLRDGSERVRAPQALRMRIACALPHRAA